MPEDRDDAPGPAEEDADGGGDGGRRSAPRAFWSGTIAFGLVTVPVELYPAQRPSRGRLRMLDEDGTPLRRRYVCPEHGEEVPPEEIVRGWEAGDGWVLVSDQELDALEPEKSREIDLREFVPLSQLDALHFDRGYYLTPSGGSTKAYRLLARVMEEGERAGIATFVMRSREYLVAIVAENGILRAETLRFADEVRSPEDVGLPEPADPGAETVAAFREAIRSRASAEVPEEELVDQRAERLERLVEEKRAAGEVTGVPEAAAGEADVEAEVIDLMEVLRQRLRGGDAGPATGEGDGAPPSAAEEDLEARTKDELYERARELEIPGRSGMTKDELADAIRRAP